MRKTQVIIPSSNRYKGYRVIAVDGIKGELPNTYEIRNKFGVSKGCQYPLFHAVASFDVLNCKFIDAEFTMSISDERKLAYTLLENHQSERDILLYDRGFPSIALIQKLNDLDQKFVARVSKSFIKEVNEFASQKALDKVVHIDYNARRGATSRVKNVKLPYAFDLRCIKVFLKSGETEILITNLSNDEFKRNDISHLYALRWGIEIGFNHLKNAINIEAFVGIKENSIKQEFYSVLIKYNILMLYINEADTMAMWNKKTSKISYKTNIRKATAIIKSKMSAMLFSNARKLSKLITQTLSLIKEFKSAVRPNRRFERKFNYSKHSVGYKFNIYMA